MKSFLLNNPGLKLLSIILASLLWFYISTQQTEKKAVSIPVKWYNPPAELVFKSIDSEAIFITISGQKENVLKAQAADFSVSLDLSKAKPGRQTYQLAPEYVKRPPGVKVIKLSPEHVTITMQPKGR
ncbi:MAG: CdaR family protein [bacterium]|nr:CdaR family protein [bacterium]